MSRWPWPEYLDGAPDPLCGWEVPKLDLDEAETRRVFLSALSKLSHVHKTLVNVPNIDEQHVVASNTARARMQDELQEARKQIHIALLAMMEANDE